MVSTNCEISFFFRAVIGPSDELSELKDLATVHVSDLILPAPKEVYSLRASQTIEDALELLTKKHIRAAPVTEDDGSGFLGLLSLSDIMSFLLSVYPSEDDLFDNYFRSISFAGFELARAQCREVLKPRQNGDASSPILASSLDMSVLFAIQILKEPFLERVAVLDESGSRCVAILSQFDLIRFLHDRHSDLPVMNETIEHLGLASAPSTQLLSARGSDTVIVAIRRMCAHKVHSLPVLDTNGHLVKHFSQHDVQITADDYAWLTLPIDSAKDPHGGKVFVVKPNEKLHHAIDVCVKHHIHQVYVVKDSHKTLIRVLTLGDLLGCFVPHV